MLQHDSQIHSYIRIHTHTHIKYTHICILHMYVYTSILLYNYINFPKIYLLLLFLKSLASCTCNIDYVSNTSYSLYIWARGDVISFEVSADTSGWVGVGFSLTPNMVRPQNIDMIYAL